MCVIFTSLLMWRTPWDPAGGRPVGVGPAPFRGCCLVAWAGDGLPCLAEPGGRRPGHRHRLVRQTVRPPGLSDRPLHPGPALVGAPLQGRFAHVPFQGRSRSLSIEPPHLGVCVLVPHSPRRTPLRSWSSPPPAVAALKAYIPLAAPPAPKGRPQSPRRRAPHMDRPALSRLRGWLYYYNFVGDIWYAEVSTVSASTGRR